VDRAGTTQNTDGEPAPVTGGANVQPAVSKAQDAPRGEPTINDNQQAAEDDVTSRVYEMKVEHLSKTQQLLNSATGSMSRPIRRVPVETVDSLAIGTTIYSNVDYVAYNASNVENRVLHQNVPSVSLPVHRHVHRHHRPHDDEKSDHHISPAYKTANSISNVQSMQKMQGTGAVAEILKHINEEKEDEELTSPALKKSVQQKKKNNQRAASPTAELTASGLEPPASTSAATPAIKSSATPAGLNQLGTPLKTAGQSREHLAVAVAGEDNSKADELELDGAKLVESLLESNKAKNSKPELVEVRQGGGGSCCGCGGGSSTASRRVEKKKRSAKTDPAAMRRSCGCRTRRSCH
jgi:hypothetical protein